MNRKERIQFVRQIMWNEGQVSLSEVAKLSGVSLRTTYRDLHSILSKPATEAPALMSRH
jgi:DeoR/GlpR family transcriptional regulator of sugar metabolism